MFLKATNDTNLKDETRNQNAVDRALLYLRCLNYPPLQSYQLVLEALKITDEQNTHKSEEMNIEQTLSVIQQIIHKSHPTRTSDEYESIFARSIEINYDPCSKGHSCHTIRSGGKIQPTPPVRRSYMKPVQLKSQKWGSVLVSWFTNAVVM